MTAAQFSAAYESATKGGEKGSDVPSNPKIISKSSEIDYEELGIGEDGHGHIGHTTPINIRDDDKNDYVGICVSPDDRGWSKGTVLPGVKRVTDTTMIKLYYYTMLDDYGENLAKSKGFGSDSDQVAIAACHEAMSMRYSELGGVEYDRPNVGSNLKSLISAYRSGVASKPTPDSDKVLVYISARVEYHDHMRQAYVFGCEKEEEPSYILLRKVSSDADMRYAYSAYYSLDTTKDGGHVNFRLYKDKACKNKATAYSDSTMTKVLDPIPVGYTFVGGLNNKAVFYCEPGTYYLKEESTPKGYQKREEPFGPFTFEEGKGKTLRLENTPTYAKIGVIKKDKKTGKGLPGAVFGLYSNAEDAKNAEDPEFELVTGDNGKSNLADVLAGKKYYVRELKAPEGYSLISGIRLMKAVEGVTETAWTELEDEELPGRVRVKKSSSDPAADHSPYSLEGAVYKLYDSAGNEAGTLTTDKNGVSNTLTVSPGTYTVQETAASPCFQIDIKAHKVTVKSDVLSTVESLEKPKTGTVLLRKKAKNPEADGELYSLAGAVYKLYDSEGKEAGTLTTDEDGVTNTLEVLCGSYTIRETKASPGFELDIEAHDLTVTADAVSEVESQEPPQMGKITVVKSSSAEKEGKEPDTQPVEGAVYTLYKTREDAVLGSGSAGEFLVKADGTSNVIEVPAGKTYYVKETKAPEGYLPDEEIYEVKVENLLETVTVYSEDTLIFGGVKVCKLDLETQSGTPLGGAQLEGAVFGIYNDGEHSIYAQGEKILPGAQAMTVTTDAAGIAQTPSDALSCGSYRIEEILSPEGYLKKGSTSVRFEIREDGEIVDLTGDASSSITDQAVRGDFSICKINSYTQERMGGVTFEVTALDREGNVLEAHRFTTDENGCYESTAAFAAGLAAADPEQGEQGGRIWFGIGTKPDDSLGALPYGDYRIEELEGENNRGMKMFSGTFSICEDMQTISLGTVENTLKPVIETELVDEDGDHYADMGSMVTLTDTVTYDGMDDYIGKEVAFRGVIYVKETGKPLMIDGSPVRAEKVKKILSHSGSVQLRFTFDASKAGGMTLVCYEYAQDPSDEPPGTDSGEDSGENPPEGEDPEGEDPQGDPSEGGEEELQKYIAAHEDPDDEAQTVRLALVETKAEDLLTGLHVGNAADGAVTVDHVTCRGLIPGTKYLVYGFLVDKSTGKPLLDQEGKEVSAQASFTAENDVETVDLTFTYDASLLDGTTVVAFEKLYLKGEQEEDPDQPEEPENPPSEPPIAVHEDPEDEDQSVHYPELRTYAAGEDGSSRTLTAEGTIKVVDRVEWKNLIPGYTYRLQGILMRKDTGEAFTVDGRKTASSAVFTPEKADGETVVRFSFDADKMDEDWGPQEAEGETGSEERRTLPLVAFEELYLTLEEGSSSGEGEDLLVGEHKDLEDEAQTVLLKEKPEEPEEPGEPEEPEEPEEPDEPSGHGKKKKHRGSSGGSSSGKKSSTRTASGARTGDDTNIAPWLIAAALSLIAVFALLIKRRAWRAHRNHRPRS